MVVLMLEAEGTCHCCEARAEGEAADSFSSPTFHVMLTANGSSCWHHDHYLFIKYIELLILDVNVVSLRI